MSNLSEEKIKTDHFKTMEELLKHLKMWETDDDYDAYYRFFCPRCAYEMAHKIDRLQKENEAVTYNFEKTVDKLEKAEKENEKLNLENQALYESINCNDDNMLARRYQKLQKELELEKEKNKKLEGQIENLMQTIRENTNAEDLLKENNNE